MTETELPTINQVRHSVAGALDPKASPRVRDLHATVARERIKRLRAALDDAEQQLETLERPGAAG